MLNDSVLAKGLSHKNVGYIRIFKIIFLVDNSLFIFKLILQIFTLKVKVCALETIHLFYKSKNSKNNNSVEILKLKKYLQLIKGCRSSCIMYGSTT